MIYAVFLLSTATSGAPADDALLRRIEALEAKNAELQARIDDLSGQSGPTPLPAPRPVPMAPATQMPAAPATVPGPAAPEQPWDHGYIGIHGGVRGVRNLDRGPDDFYDYSAPRQAGEFAGLQIGKRWQTGRLVLGTEVSASFGLNDHLREIQEVRPPFTSPDLVFTYKRNYAVAMKGDLGLALGNSLVYASAGVDVARVSSFSNANITQTRYTEASPFWGFGAAHRTGRDLVVETEGRYGYSRLGYYSDDISIRLKLNYIFP